MPWFGQARLAASEFGYHYRYWINSGHPCLRLSVPQRECDTSQYHIEFPFFSLASMIVPCSTHRPFLISPETLAQNSLQDLP